MQIFVMGLFNNCPDLICVLTTVSFKKKVLSFQNPGRLAIECRSKLLIISECSVLQPNEILALEKLRLSLSLARKKSYGQEISGLLRRQVYKRPSVFRTLLASIRSSWVTNSPRISRNLPCVADLLPLLSTVTSETRLKSPSQILSLHANSIKWPKKNRSLGHHRWVHIMSLN